MEENASGRSEPLVLLKPGADGPSIFLAHGMAGTPAEFQKLITAIDSPKSIYGLQARGNYGIEEPYDRIEGLAQYYLKAIKTVQPHGPYIMIGYSLGGLATLEMAQRLSYNGETVALLAMVESYPHPSQLALAQRLRLLPRRAKRHISNFVNPPVVYEQFLKSSGDIEERNRERLRMEAIRRSANLAWTHYRPTVYPGKICFVKAERLTDFPSDPVAVWKKLAKEFEVQTVPGDHHEILTTHYQILGSILSRYIAESPLGQSAKSSG